MLPHVFGAQQGASSSLQLVHVVAAGYAAKPALHTTFVPLASRFPQVVATQHSSLLHATHLVVSPLGFRAKPAPHHTCTIRKRRAGAIGKRNDWLEAREASARSERVAPHCHTCCGCRTWRSSSRSRCPCNSCIPWKQAWRASCRCTGPLRRPNLCGRTSSQSSTRRRCPRRKCTCCSQALRRILAQLIQHGDRARRTASSHFDCVWCVQLWCEHSVHYAPRLQRWHWPAVTCFPWIASLNDTLGVAKQRQILRFFSSVLNCMLVALVL